MLFNTTREVRFSHNSLYFFSFLSDFTLMVDDVNRTAMHAAVFCNACGPHAPIAFTMLRHVYEPDSLPTLDRAPKSCKHSQVWVLYVGGPWILRSTRVGRGCRGCCRGWVLLASGQPKLRNANLECGQLWASPWPLPLPLPHLALRRRFGFPGPLRQRVICIL